MKQINKLQKRIAGLHSQLEQLHWQQGFAAIQAVYGRMPVDDLREIVEGFDSGTLTRERFNELWMAVGGNTVAVEEWEGVRNG